MAETLNFEEEAKRLSSLLKTNLLETPIENRFERVTRLLQNMLNVPITVFNLIDEERQWAKSIQGINAVEVPREQSFCSHTIQGNRIMVVNDARFDERFADNPLVTGNPNIVFYAGCPVRAPDGHKIGALCAVDRKPRQLQPREMQILRDLAGVLESELRLDDMSRKVEGLEIKLSASELHARVDALTRLPNREGMFDILQRQWAGALRHKKPIAVVTADIDHMKTLNEKYGRETGDEALRQMGRVLLSAMRYEDSVGRVEGGEFVMILPDCSEDHLLDTVERIRLETMLADVETEHGIIPVTISFGATTIIPDEDMQMTDLLEQADLALGIAKQRGRNRAVLYRPDMSKAA